MTRAKLLCLVLALGAFAEVRHEDVAKGAGEDWLTYAGSYSGWRYSPLNQITADNVRNMVPIIGAGRRIGKLGFGRDEAIHRELNSKSKAGFSKRVRLPGWRHTLCTSGAISNPLQRHYQVRNTRLRQFVH